MKTVYIPAGATYNYETLVTDNVIVHGHLHVTNGLKAKHISGRGFITAGEVSADIVDVTELGVGKTIFVGDLAFENLKFVTPASTAVCAVRVTRASRGAAAQA